MILIVGGTSRLGVRVTRLLRARGQAVRIMTRRPDEPTAVELRALGAEVVRGDLRDRASVAAACAGATRVLASAHAFPGDRANNPANVDDLGNRALIAEASKAGVSHFVLVSIAGVTATHEIEFFRIKHRAEEELRRSGLGFTILRAAAFMESWAVMVGEPLLRSGQTTIFGRGQNPVNFVSADDVAKFAVIALEDPRAKDLVLEVGGPENHTLTQVAEVFERLRGRPATKKHAPLVMLKVMSRLVGPFNPGLGRAMRAGVYMDTADQTLDMSKTLSQFPVALTRLEDFVKRQYQNWPGQS
jgi:uncharacterized protein YbjT (DUF2867 family)